MKTLYRATVVIVCLLACSGMAVLAQTEEQPAEQPPQTEEKPKKGGTTYGADRLFLQFERDAAIIPNQWWEGDVVFTDADNIDATVARLVFALQPFKQVELGGRVGFGTTSTSGGLPSGSGATDLEAWGKWAGTMGASQKTEIAFGGILSLPTGDDNSGLGTDSWNFAVFGAFRYPLRFAVLSWNVGFRANQDGQIVGIPIEGKTSAFLGGGILWPISDRFTVVGEIDYESERFERFDDDLRALGGVNWRVGNTGVVRGGLGFGATSGAPNWQLIAGYAYTF